MQLIHLCFKCQFALRWISVDEQLSGLMWSKGSAVCCCLLLPPLFTQQTRTHPHSHGWSFWREHQANVQWNSIIITEDAVCARATTRWLRFFDISHVLTSDYYTECNKTLTVPPKLNLPVHMMCRVLGGILCLLWCCVRNNSWEEANKHGLSAPEEEMKATWRLAMPGLHDSFVALRESFQALSFSCLRQDPKPADAAVGTDTGGLTCHRAYQCGLRVTLKHTSWRLVHLVTGKKISIVDIGDMDRGTKLAHGGAETVKLASQILVQAWA